MPDPESTRWTVIRAAAGGDADAREEFARVYEPIVRAYLGARWGRTPLYPEIDDAAQEAFVECLRAGGALTRAEETRPGGFRAFLHGVVRNVARRVEGRRARDRGRGERNGLDLDALAGDEPSLSRVFDRAWARSLLAEALDLLAGRAEAEGDHALRRLELLRLRFEEDLPVREIAARWNEEPSRIHYHYARAREEYRAALRDVVRRHEAPGAVDEACARLLEHVRE